MFSVPKELKKTTGESLVYCHRRVMVSKEFTFDAAHHLFNYDGKCNLNESLPYMNTTAENMVYWIFKQVAKHLPKEREIRIEYVRLYETPSSYAEFRREWLLDD